MPTVEEIVRQDTERAGRLLVRRIAEHEARRKEIRAKFASKCGQCRGVIEVGDPIVQPYERNSQGGNRFGSIWYCRVCGNAAHNEAAPGFVGPHLATLGARK